MNKTTALIFILGIFRTFAYELFDEKIQAYVWNISGAVVIICLLLISFNKFRNYLFLMIMGWWIYEELLVIACSLGRIFFKWDEKIGMDILSAKFNLPCGAISTCLIAYLAVLIYKENKRAALKP